MQMQLFWVAITLWMKIIIVGVFVRDLSRTFFCAYDLNIRTGQWSVLEAWGLVWPQ